MIAIRSIILSHLILSGCAVSNSPMGSLNAANEFAIAADMVAVMINDWPPAQTHLYSPPTSNNEFENNLRRAGYSVTNMQDATNVPVRLSIHRLNNLDYYQALLTVNTSWRLSRMYRRIRGQLQAVTGFTLAGGRGVKGPIRNPAYRLEDTASIPQSTITDYWYIDIARALTEDLLTAAKIKIKALDIQVSIVPSSALAEQYSLRAGPFAQSSKATFALGAIRAEGFDQAALVATKEATIDAGFSPVPSVNVPAPCTYLKIKVGSLRTTTTDLLKECGYSMGNWDLEDGSQVHDWIIKTPYAIATDTGIWGLLDLLKTTYGIDGYITSDKYINFSEASR